MNRRIIFLLFFVSTAYYSVVAQGPLLYLSFDGSTADSSINGATVSGAVRYGFDRNGIADQAIEFLPDHYDDLIVEPGSAAVALEPPFTYAAWIRFDDESLAFPICTSDSTRFHGGLTFQRAGDGFPAVTFGDGVSGGTFSRVTYAGTNQPVNLGEWIHMAVTVESLTGGNPDPVTLYVNGVTESTRVEGTGRIQNFRLFNSPFRLGQKWNIFFVGGIDELAVYDRVLDPSEILDIRDKVTPINGPVDHERFTLFPTVVRDVMTLTADVPYNHSSVFARSSTGQQHAIKRVAGETFSVAELLPGRYWLEIYDHEGKLVGAPGFVKQ